MANRAQRAVLALVLTTIVIIVVVKYWSTKDQPIDGKQNKGESTVARTEPQGVRKYDPSRPAVAPSNGYVSSAVCKDCHQENHATWFASYHRTMTQVATPEAVFGDFDHSTVMAYGRKFEMDQRSDGVYWVTMDDPDQAPTSVTADGQSRQRIQRPLVMTTGSHHMQVYWYPTGESRTLGQFPLIYLKETESWIPRTAAFLKPPKENEYSGEKGRWSETCNKCHSTFPRAVRLDNGDWNTHVAEFGISCEACHGPGLDHVSLHQMNNTKATNKSSKASRDPIVNPAKLPHRLKSQVCGQCHSMATPRRGQYNQPEGSAYRPGKDLLRSHILIRDDEASRLHYSGTIPPEKMDEFMELSFWPDGMIRVSGREYNGLVESGCFQHGEMSCFSCHALHQPSDDPRPIKDWADDQLQVEMRDDKACLQCHDNGRYGTSHTHHDAASVGARCYNCHMPHTTYGLLKAIRSHQISRPNIGVDEGARRPNACNLCHLDQTVQWSANHLKQWYDIPMPDLDQDQQHVAAGPLWLLKGDAGKRALVAWSLSWPPAVEAAGADWQTPFLAELLVDPYDAVRFIAARSLRAVPGQTEFDYDFVGPTQDREAAKNTRIQLWTEQWSRSNRANSALLIDPDRGLDRDAIQRLLDQRDNREVYLVE